MMLHAAARPHPAEEEQLVNDFAVAYWRHYGEPEKWEQLCQTVEETFHKFVSPAPEGMGYMEYAKRTWGLEEMMTFNNYGWFQFGCVRHAISREKSLEQALAGMCSLRILPRKRERMRYEVTDEMAIRVVENAVERLESRGIAFPLEVSVAYCDDVNCHMCRVYGKEVYT